MAERWLDTDEAAAYLSVRPHDIPRLVRERRIPEPSRQLGPRRPRWDRIALDACLSGEIRSSVPNSADAALEAMRAEYSKPRRANRSQAAR